jgi:ABC-type tungstate transport system permease subunit
MKRINCMLALTLLFAVFFVTPGFSAPPAEKNIILATTTSTQDTGLLDVLIPAFEKKTGYFVKTIAVGSGQAMTMGQKGEADVLRMALIGDSSCIMIMSLWDPPLIRQKLREQNQQSKSSRK